MLEKLIERLKEIEELFNTTMANLNALNGAKQELQNLIDWHHQQSMAPKSPEEGDKTGEVV